MRFRFIEDHRQEHPVRLMCHVLGVSPSGYYAWRGRPESMRATANRALLADIRRLHERHRGRYGSPRIHAALRAEGGTASRGRVERLMRRHGIRGVAARRFRPVTTDSRHGLPIAPDLLGQGFQAPAPNRVWLSDITYIATEEGWLYLAAVLDLATRKVVGWAMREHLRTELVSAALLMAAQRQQPTKGLIIHSDRGSQYASKPYRTLLEGRGMRQSMSRKGDCWDDALASRACWPGFLRKRIDHSAINGELLPHAQGRARSSGPLRQPRGGQARELFAYLEGYYTRQRLHSALGCRTPEHAERLAA